ncbi:MAG: hypothetical protein ACJ736_07860 [Streptomyces sp.]
MTGVEENAAADAVTLTPDQLARLDALTPPSGERYAEGDLARTGL